MRELWPFEIKASDYDFQMGKNTIVLAVGGDMVAADIWTLVWSGVVIWVGVYDGGNWWN
jgi:hypothetical protein